MVQYHKLREMADFDVDNDNCLEMDELEGCPIRSAHPVAGPSAVHRYNFCMICPRQQVPTQVPREKTSHAGNSSIGCRAVPSLPSAAATKCDRPHGQVTLHRRKSANLLSIIPCK